MATSPSYQAGYQAYLDGKTLADALFVTQTLNWKDYQGGYIDGMAVTIRAIQTAPAAKMVT